MYKTGTRYSLKSTNTFTALDLERISQAVVSVKRPKFKITRDIKHYGNFDFVTPIYDLTDIQLVVTFEETDDCLISYKLVSALTGNSVKSTPTWLNVHEHILLTINEYDPNTLDLSKYDESVFGQTIHQNYNTTLKHNFICKLIDYTEPHYSRTSDTPSAATVQLTFLALPIDINTPLYMNDNSTVRMSQINQLDISKTLDQVIADIVEITNKLPTMGSEALSAAYRLGAKNFNISSEEVELAAKKINSKLGKGVEVTVDTVKKLHEENAKRMSAAYSKFSELLKKHGIDVDVNTYNDVEHAYTPDSDKGSHLLAQKIDLSFTTSSGKIGHDNITLQQLNTINNAAKQAGFVVNWETTGNSGSLWGDFALQNVKSIDSTSGKLINLQIHSSWTGENMMYNTTTKQYTQIAK